MRLPSRTWIIVAVFFGVWLAVCLGVCHGAVDPST